MFDEFEFDGDRLVPAGARKLDNSKIDWNTFAHSNSSMLREGVHPEGTTREDVEAKVKGTFGGRFEHFCGGKFRYIAYTE